MDKLGSGGPSTGKSEPVGQTSFYTPPQQSQIELLHWPEGRLLFRRGGLCVHAIDASSARVDVFFIYMYINEGQRVERVDLTLAKSIAA